MTVETSAGNPFDIPELGVHVGFGKEGDLRHNGDVNIYDLLSIGVANGNKLPNILKIISRQLYIYNHSDSHWRHETRYDLVRLSKFASGKEKLPFLLGHALVTALAFGVMPDFDATVFYKDVKKYVPPDDEFIRNGYTMADLEKVASGPAKLAGAVAIFHWDGMDENAVLLGRRGSGYYKGRLNIPGGHAEGPLDSVSLNELIEETGVDRSLTWRARPLGTADQVIFVQHQDEKPTLTRYINLIWQINASFDERVYKAGDMGWRMWLDDEFRMSSLTPIAIAALELGGFGALP